MEEPPMLITQVTKDMQNWTVRVTITEDISLLKCQKETYLKRYVLCDSEGNEIIGGIYGLLSFVKKYMTTLELFKVYDVSNAQVKEVPKMYRILKCQDEWRIQKDTLIRPVPHGRPNLRYLIDGLTPCSIILRMIESGNKSVDIMGIAIEATEILEANTQDGPKTIQRFTLLNTEKQPMVITLWADMVINQGPSLEAAVQNNSVVIAKRLNPKNYNGISLSTKNSTSFTINPPINAAAELKAWFETLHHEELQQLLSDDPTQISKRNVDDGNIKVQTVNEVDISTEAGDYWIKGELQVPDEDKKLYYIACNNCNTKIRTSLDMQYPCVICQKNVTSALRTIVLLTVTDQSGSMKVTALHNIAERILQTTATNIARLLRAGAAYDLTGIKTDLEGKTFLMMLRRSSRKTEDDDRRLVLMDYFPQDEQTTGSNSTEQTTSSELSPLKRQLNRCILDTGSPAKRKLVLNEPSDGSTVQGKSQEKSSEESEAGQQS